MQNLLEDLKKLLKKDERLTVDGDLLKNKIVELALKLDADLIKLLLSHDTLKEHFFIRIGKATIFDKDKFIKFVSNKQFLPNSYTAFKNKIGLTEGDEYISEEKDVVLSWPYKDCVLEGGQTKEDTNREEIFWNQTLAPDEIDRLLDPKVFTSAKRVDKDGEHEFDKFNRHEDGTISDNLIIKGNNLLALHSLEKEFAGKVKLIYIDPPYNTGNDSFGYNDRFNHSTWLTFMKNRLEVARNLLSKDGSIYVQLDYNEVHYFKVLMDEVFGRNNFRREISVSTGWALGFKASAKNWIKVHDTILFYSKTNEYFFKKQHKPYDVDYEERARSDEDGRLWVDQSLGSISDEKLEELKREDNVYQTSTGNWRKKQYLDEMKGQLITDFWEDLDPINSQSREKTQIDGQKSEELIMRIITSCTQKGDLVLDFFAGSGTTGAVAHKMGRQYILCEQLTEHADVIEGRMKKVIDGEQGGISEDVDWQGGGDYVYLELAKWDQEFVEKVKEAKSKKELEKFWEEMRKRAFLSWRLDFDKLEKNAKLFADLSSENQKKFLLEVLDQNQLYVNYSEIEDEMYGVSEEDKKLNKEFYG